MYAAMSELDIEHIFNPDILFINDTCGVILCSQTRLDGRAHERKHTRVSRWDDCAKMMAIYKVHCYAFQVHFHVFPAISLKLARTGSNGVRNRSSRNERPIFKSGYFKTMIIPALTSKLCVWGSPLYPFWLWLASHFWNDVTINHWWRNNLEIFLDHQLFVRGNWKRIFCFSTTI